MVWYCCSIVWLKCLGSVIGSNPKIYQQLTRTYVGNQFICAFESPRIYILQVRAYFIVSWNRCSFFSRVRAYFIVSWNSCSFFWKKKTKPQIDFYARLSWLTHLCIVSNKAIARQNKWSTETRVKRRMYLNWLWVNYKVTVGLRCQPFEVDACCVRDKIYDALNKNYVCITSHCE